MGTRQRINGLYAAHGDKLRYLVVGAFNTMLGYGLFVALLAVIGGPLGALSTSSAAILAFAGRDYYVIVQWMAWALSVPPNTLTMKYLVFRTRGNSLHQIARAYLVYLPALGLSSLVLLLTVRVAHLTPQVGQLFAIAIVTVFTYLGHKHFTFRGVLKDGSAHSR
jgi:putative flippase GtrA